MAFKIQFVEIVPQSKQTYDCTTSILDVKLGIVIIPKIMLVVYAAVEGKVDGRT